MRDNRINYVLVGTFVIGMFVAMVVFIALITGRTGGTDSYYAVYENVGGVKFGTKVLYEGFTIGQVESITPERGPAKMAFKVELAVKRGWVIPDDSVARIAASGLLAAVAVDIKGGTSGTSVSPGGTMRSQAGGNMFAAMSDVAAEVTSLSQTGLRPLVETINRTVAAFGPVLEQRAPQLLDNLVAVSSDLAAKTPRISANVEQMTQGLNHVLSPENTRKIDATLSNAERASSNLAELTGSLHASKAKVDALIADLDKAVVTNSGTVDQSLKDLRYSLQAVARNIDSVTYNLEGTSRNMNEFSREIRQNPSVLLGGTKPSSETGPR
jgi:phospholipid/cholesterol/gamma-HCH transport system substrate-binding protein